MSFLTTGLTQNAEGFSSLMLHSRRLRDSKFLCSGAAERSESLCFETRDAFQDDRVAPDLLLWGRAVFLSWRHCLLVSESCQVTGEDEVG